MPSPCPICSAPYGFHDEAPHLAASARIPAELCLPPTSVERDERSKAKHAANEAWLAAQGVA